VEEKVCVSSRSSAIKQQGQQAACRGEVDSCMQQHHIKGLCSLAVAMKALTL
jgi:hypothetical protein